MSIGPGRPGDIKPPGTRGSAKEMNTHFVAAGAVPNRTYTDPATPQTCQIIPPELLS
jgi:hypothetical protein